MTNNERLKDALRIRMGLPPGHPTDTELEAIARKISEIWATRTPTDADWEAACNAFVPNAGKYRYAGEDHSDLNQLLMQLLDS